MHGEEWSLPSIRGRPLREVHPGDGGAQSGKNRMGRNSCPFGECMKAGPRIDLIGEENDFSIPPRIEPVERSQINHQLVHAHRADHRSRAPAVTDRNQDLMRLGSCLESRGVSVGAAHGKVVDMMIIL